MWRPITIGSLFDGIGAFPYAFSFYGGETLWASEILPEAIAVTSRHFPDMKHIGDIKNLSGELLPPVDVICFGSPCQDLSTASGKRAGLAGERSGLFMEAIRIIKEMRESTNGKYPRYAIWENVLGAFSSGTPKGSDFLAVLEAFTDTEIPMPDSGRWSHFGMVRSNTADVAWAVYNAADFGLAQRRKRCFVVADFTGTSASEILLIPKSLFGNLAPSGETGQDAPAAPYGSSELSDTERLAAFNGGASAGSGIAYNTKVVPTLRSGPGSTMTPYVVLNDQGVNSLNVESGECSPTLRSEAHGNLPVVAHGEDLLCVATAQANAEMSGELCPTITEAAGKSGNNKPYIVHPQTAGTLCASAAGLTRPAGMVSETDLTIAYCLQGNMIGRELQSGPAGGGVNEEIAYTLNGTDRHCAVAIDCRNYHEVGCISGALQAKSTGGYSLNYQNPIRIGYCVRRLTPTECERLMGFPDGWTALNHDGKEISDNRRYQMLGNSIATPCAAYIALGIYLEYQKEEQTIGS